MLKIILCSILDYLPMYRIHVALIVVLLGASLDVSAGVIADNTRIIYNIDKKEQSFQVVNINDYPVLVQLWVDDGGVDSSPEKASNSPVIPLPAIFKLKSKEAKSIRLVKIDDNIAADRETLYWLTIYEVPPTPEKGDNADNAADDNKAVLILTTRTQMKLLLRPAALFNQVETMPTNVSFKWVDKSLVLMNNSPFYVTIASLRLSDKDDKTQYSGMLEPFSEIAVAWEPDSQPESLVMTYIDDYGSQNDVVISKAK
ncbi:fimbrial biogenesis chaperone [Shewanella putrefaciens]|uniref:fimbrial biogenesis chaperone n=1 Tax=Shewanella putrefaciens TaxID=24 RepID=UPI00286586BA|nr:molecular chaperone [Shewanella putrefaciens]MDR6965088.1 P pilus assembly chaperone PapD [Shewanella putrefaciens]